MLNDLIVLTSLCEGDLSVHIPVDVGLSLDCNTLPGFLVDNGCRRATNVPSWVGWDDATDELGYEVDSGRCTA